MTAPKPKVTFVAPPGTSVSGYVGPDARAVSYTFDDKGELAFNEEDAEPVEFLSQRADSPDYPTITMKES